MHGEFAAAQEWARNYFGDFRTDFRNKYVVSYVHSDFDGNHTFKVKKREYLKSKD